MDPSTLASDNGAAGMTTFTIPDSRSCLISSPPPCRPPQAAHIPYTLPSSSRQPAHPTYPALDEKHAYSPRQSYYNNGYGRGPPVPLVPGTSVSSAGGTSVMTGHTIDTIDIEKGIAEARSRQPDSRRSSKVVRPRQEMVERQQNASFAPSSRPGRDNLPYDRSSLTSDVDDEQHLVEQRRMLESKAPNILLFLSGPCAALSFVLCIYSLLATLVIFIAAPVRICTTPRFSLWEQLLSALTSAQRLHLRCIYAPAANLEGKSVASLLFNLVVSPILSMGVALAAWTVAIYWIFAAVVGDPDGSEGGDDGRATVVGLRKWWDNWLSRAIRDD